MRLLLALYDLAARHRGLTVGLLALLAAAMAALAARLDYDEDIAAFLPTSQAYREAMQTYRDVSAGDQIVVELGVAPPAQPAPDLVVRAIAAYADTLSALDAEGWTATLGQGDDPAEALAVMDVMYGHLPCLLTEADYAQLDSAWTADTAFVDHRLAETRRLLASPLGGQFSEWVGLDPLGLFGPVGARMKAFLPLPAPTGDAPYALYGGRLFTPDLRYAYVTMRSPFGSSETGRGGQLAEMLAEAGARVGQALSTDSARLTATPLGAPIIAAANARQIRHDSLVALAIAATLILTLLGLSLRSLRSMALIAVATLFGALFALSVIALWRTRLSVIVLGIAASIVGIAVNYPLHFVCHLRHTPDVRSTLRQLAPPLVIGNVTTVGAFLTLVPLEATALRDLGLCSALTLVGTIAFTLVFLPHLCPTPTRPTARPVESGGAGLYPAHGEDVSDGAGSHQAPEVGASGGAGSHPAHIGGDTGEPGLHPATGGGAAGATETTEQPAVRHWRRPWITALALALPTLALGWLSRLTAFDSDLRHLNYIEPAQQAGLDRLAALRGEAQGQTVYLTARGTTYDDAAAALRRLGPVTDSLARRGLVAGVKDPTLLLPPLADQQASLGRWQALWHAHGLDTSEGRRAFTEAARRQGFTAEAFAPFLASVTTPPGPIDAAERDVVGATVLRSAVSGGAIVAELTVSPDATAEVEAALRRAAETAAPASTVATADGPAPTAEVSAFDLATLTRDVTDTLTADFNYIGMACGCIVLLFLCLSFRRIELALVAFLPMAIGWLWILGLMQACDIRFNIVNVILATFIFGQGDDYTIFITEGLVDDYVAQLAHARRRRRALGATAAGGAVPTEAEPRPVLVSYRRSILLSALIMLIGIGALIVSRHPALHSLAEVTIVGMAVVVLMAWLVPPLVFQLLVRHVPPFRAYLERRADALA